MSDPIDLSLSNDNHLAAVEPAITNNEPNEQNHANSVDGNDAEISAQTHQPHTTLGKETVSEMEQDPVDNSVSIMEQNPAENSETTTTTQISSTPLSTTEKVEMKSDTELDEVVANLEVADDHHSDKNGNDGDANNADEEEDLEDGEIDDDDECVLGVSDKTEQQTTTKNIEKLDDYGRKLSAQPVATQSGSSITTVDLSLDDHSVPTPPSGSQKSKKPKPVEDDHMSNIENAIASALKKKGIDPVMPKILESRSLENNAGDIGPGQGTSRSSRRRKRKKQRDEKEKEKDRKERKRQRYDSTERYGGLPDDDDIMDEDEMLNVRGGSPPPGLPLHSYKDQFDSADESESSYDSYDSAYEVNMGANAGAGASDGNSRRRRRGKRDARKRRDRGRNRDDERSNNRQDKRKRRNSEDEKFRQEPRKLEVCKFYIEDCCAKKEKCSYMHAEFPCKFYYLGMECTSKDDCKFAHAGPLTEPLRNILLKHLETAPKVILGNFNRISREAAIEQMTKRHEELCKEAGVENTWSMSTLPLPSRRDHMGHNHQQQQQQQKPQHQPSSIPSLLDIVINPPGSGPKSDKRKSRWANELGLDGTKDTGSSNSDTTRSNAKVEVSSSNGPASLDLKNLSGILSNDVLEKLKQFGLTNLEQFYQLTFGQMNEIGLTITEMKDIQEKSNALTKGVKTEQVTGESTLGRKDDAQIEDSTKKTKLAPNKESERKTNWSSRDDSSKRESEFKSDHDSNKDSDMDYASCSKSIHYSQYVKDSHFAYDRNDLYDDDEDAEQLIIDDGNMDTDNQNKDIDVNKSTEKPESFAGRITMNPFSSDRWRTDTDDLQRTKDTRGSHNQLKNVFSKYDNDDEERSRERSCTPTGSSTPEASRSPDPEEEQPHYERSTMYDFNPRDAEDEEKHNELASSTKADKDMRFPLNPGSDTDLRLPFQPVMHYTPATEIDGSITSHLPMTYKVNVVDVPPPNYAQLRKSFKTTNSTDPRLRRIVGLPDLAACSPTVTQRVSRKLSNSIASPDSEDASPKPPQFSNTNSHVSDSERKSTLRADPRRAAAAAAASNNANNTNQVNPSARINTNTGGGGNTGGSNSSNALGQKILKTLLERSEWYNKLNSNSKITVNQNLAQLSAELKNFHNRSSDKAFNLSIITNNHMLQQILLHLKIYIDEYGNVKFVDTQSDDSTGVSLNLPDITKPPPLQNPPPMMSMAAPIMVQAAGGGTTALFQNDIQQQFNRNSLLGNPFNPFGLGAAAPGALNFNNGPGILPQIGFPNFGANALQQQQQQQLHLRNFNNFSNQHQQRNHRNNNQNRRKP